MGIVAKYYGINEEELFSRKRSTVRQRKMAIYLCKILSGRKNGDIGRAFVTPHIGLTLHMTPHTHIEVKAKIVAKLVKTMPKQ